LFLASLVQLIKLLAKLETNHPPQEVPVTQLHNQAKKPQARKEISTLEQQHMTKVHQSGKEIAEKP